MRHCSTSTARPLVHCRRAVRTSVSRAISTRAPADRSRSSSLTRRRRVSPMRHASWQAARRDEGGTMKRTHLGVLAAAVLALIMAADQRPAHASIITGSVSLDTSALSGSFELAFVFTDGSGAGDANNTV